MNFPRSSFGHDLTNPHDDLKPQHALQIRVPFGDSFESPVSYR
jgi:hypothetical protein